MHRLVKTYSRSRSTLVLRYRVGNNSSPLLVSDFLRIGLSLQSITSLPGTAALRYWIGDRLTHNPLGDSEKAVLKGEFQNRIEMGRAKRLSLRGAGLERGPRI